MNLPDSSTSPRRSFNSGISGAYCALTSTSGIIGTGTSPEEVAEQEPGREQTDRDDDSVIDPTEILVYPPVTGSDTPPDACPGKAPDRRADEREDGVPPERRAEHPGGNRDERAHERGHTPDQHRCIPALVEPALRTREGLRAQVQPPSPPLDQRPPAVSADRPTDDRPQQVPDRTRHRDDHEPPEGACDRVSEQGR